MRKYLLPLLVLLLANVALFYKFYFQGLIPFPGDLLVSYYFPWNGGGFPGFDPWTTRKDVIAMDVIRQIYPWKVLAFDLIKQGQLPFWNPFNFSGTPLLANLQSSVFFPTSSLFLILPNLPAWLIQVVILPFLLSLFSYIFLRALNLTRIAALFGAVVISNISYITVWAEQLVVIQSVVFLPLILYFITKKKILYSVPFLAFSLFGGHIQSTVYVYLITIAYAFFIKTKLRDLLLTLLLSLALSGIQLVPSLELFLLSAREGGMSRDLFYTSTFPWQNLITFLAPDFFGNPATNNFRGIDYGNFQGYFGVIAFILSVIAVIHFKKNSSIVFFTFLGLIGLLFSLAPFAHVFEILKIPVLSSGYPSRMIFIFQFSFAILSAYGLNYLIQEKYRLGKILILLILIGSLYVALLLITFLTPSPELLVTRSNLLLPFVLFLLTSFFILIAKFSTSKVLLILLLFSLFEYSYFFNKYQPFAKQEFAFPSHPVFTFLQKSAHTSRFYGADRAYVDNNFATYYRVYSPEGYDPLYIKRYGELLSKGPKVQRSDAVVPQQDSNDKERMLDLLGVSYQLDKTDDPQTDYGPNLDRFPKDNFTFLKQLDKWKFYERKNALPRAKLFDTYEVKQSGIIDSLYNPSFDITKTLLLEKVPSLSISSGSGSVTLTNYSPNKVVLTTNTETNQLLFLSDNYYPGWKVTVDGKETELLRANYTFRAAAIPKGKHQVVMLYDPTSFKIGLGLTLISLIFWLLCLKKFTK